MHESLSSRFAWSPDRHSGGMRRSLTATLTFALALWLSSSKYPRIVFGVSVSLQRVLDFAKKGLLMWVSVILIKEPSLQR
jgi:hypothetical protein